MSGMLFRWPIRLGMTKKGHKTVTLGTGMPVQLTKDLFGEGLPGSPANPDPERLLRFALKLPQNQHPFTLYSLFSMKTWHSRSTKVEICDVPGYYPFLLSYPWRILCHAPADASCLPTIFSFFLSRCWRPSNCGMRTLIPPASPSSCG